MSTSPFPDAMERVLSMRTDNAGRAETLGIEAVQTLVACSNLIVGVVGRDRSKLSSAVGACTDDSWMVFQSDYFCLDSPEDISSE